MNYGNLIVIALRALNNNKLRGFLTMLGIIIGVSSVISMLAIGEGSKRSIEKQIEELGANMVVVTPTNALVGGIRQNGVIVQTLKLEDYRAIESEVPYLESCSPYVTKSGQAIFGSYNTPTSIYGMHAFNFSFTFAFSNTLLNPLIFHLLNTFPHGSFTSIV